VSPGGEAEGSPGSDLPSRSCSGIATELELLVQAGDDRPALERHLARVRPPGQVAISDRSLRFGLEQAPPAAMVLDDPVPNRSRAPHHLQARRLEEAAALERALDDVGEPGLAEPVQSE
jgi:hypothetical protein